MTEKIGVIAFAFGLREVEPSPCNQRLAQVVRQLIQEKGRQSLLISVSWEIAAALNEDEVDQVFLPDKEKYAGSEGNVAVATPLFQKAGITEVYVVAHPFLHLSKCVRLVKEAGFEMTPYKMPRIGFDTESSQWWVRNPIALVAYACMQAAGKILKGSR